MASLLPVFMFEYAHLDPKLLNSGGGFAGATGGPPGHGNSTGGPAAHGPPAGGHSNPLEALAKIPGAEPLNRVNLLSSIPMLIIGVSSYLLVPASAAFGRRSVLIFCSLLNTVTLIWAGLSTSLESHLAARCMHAIGAGAIESLIPLVIQDMTYLHQRSRAISLSWASAVCFVTAT